MVCTNVPKFCVYFSFMIKFLSLCYYQFADLVATMEILQSCCHGNLMKLKLSIAAPRETLTKLQNIFGVVYILHVTLVTTVYIVIIIMFHNMSPW